MDGTSLSLSPHQWRELRMADFRLWDLLQQLVDCRCEGLITPVEHDELRQRTLQQRMRRWDLVA